MSLNSSDSGFLLNAFEQAKKSYREGGLPIGVVMVENGVQIGVGHNRRVQDGDLTAHGEMDCFRHVGRRAGYRGVTLFTTLSPCMMCAGTIVQFGIERVVVGEDRSFPGNLEFLRQHGVDVELVNWNEDIAGRENV